MKENYQKKLDILLQTLQEENRRPSLYLHSCCAPCSSYVLLYLANYFTIRVFYYNPNISPETEYQKRVSEQSRLIEQVYAKQGVSFEEGEYCPEKFYEMAKGLEQVPEGGERCFRCYELRLLETARRAKERGFDYFATTLSISPHKNAEKLNEIGDRIGQSIGIMHLPSDFKKKEGYKQSIDLSHKYGLYRQDYCGCIYSRR